MSEKEKRSIWIFSPECVITKLASDRGAGTEHHTCAWISRNETGFPIHSNDCVAEGNQATNVKEVSSFTTDEGGRCPVCSRAAQRDIQPPLSSAQIQARVRAVNAAFLKYGNLSTTIT